MSATNTYSNELEQYFGELPGWLQSPLRPIYDEMDKWLKAVAGNPQQLLSAGTAYTALGHQIQQLADQQKQDRAKLQGEWNGQAYQAFTAKMEQVEKQIGALAKSTGATPKVLEAAAKACVEGANAIIQIIVALIGFLITSFVVNAILAVVTFGVSLAAEVAEAIADGLASLAQTVSVVARLASILEKVAMIFEKIVKALREIEMWLKLLKEGLQVAKEEAGAVKWMRGGAPALWKVAHTAGMIPVVEAANPIIEGASGGHLKIPGGVGDLIGAGQDYNNANNDVQQAEKAANE